MDVSKLTDAERAIFRAGMVHAFEVMKVSLFGGNTSIAQRGKITIHPDPSPEWVAEKRGADAKADANLRASGAQF